MEILKLSSATKSFIWGGEKLKKEWNKKSSSNIIAESWEVSCHKEGPSIIENGTYSGMTLIEFIKNNPNFLGKDAHSFEFFPVLIKLIDAKTNLSVQVHPSDEYALKYEGQYGKTEMWYVVESEQGSGVYCGFNASYSKEDVANSLNDGTIVDKLNFIPTKPGDCIFIPAGTVHAICGGQLIYEIQQNSSITYRLYDYDRVDKNGKKRELHVEKSLEVANTSYISKKNETVKIIDNSEKQLAQCKYFTTREIVVNEEKTINMTDNSFAAFTVIAGTGSVSYLKETYALEKGDTFIIGAGSAPYIIDGIVEIIETRI